MKDLLGKELSIDDVVALIGESRYLALGESRYLALGKITKINEKKREVKIIYYAPHVTFSKSSKCVRHPHTIIKLNEQELSMYFLRFDHLKSDRD